MGKLPRNEGKNSLIAFVFSCPGSLEEKNKQLVQGQTGTNLTELIRILREDKVHQKLFDSENRFDYRITNASNAIHYKAKDGISEPTNAEIMSEENINRLIDDLKGYKIIITFGEKANAAVNACQGKIDDPKIIRIRHLGFQSINQIKVDNTGKEIRSSYGDSTVGKENTQRRLRVIAKELASQLE